MSTNLILNYLRIRKTANIIPIMQSYHAYMIQKKGDGQTRCSCSCEEKPIIIIFWIAHLLYFSLPTNLNYMWHFDLTTITYVSLHAMSLILFFVTGSMRNLSEQS
jgi:hypothetical protein